VRWATSCSVCTLTDMPKRSSSCGRSSPSCTGWVGGGVGGWFG
jgi:hypothetical protein